MPGTLIGQKNSPFLGRVVQFTLIGQKNSPFLGRVVRPTYDAADRSVRAILNAQQKTDEAFAISRRCLYVYSYLCNCL